jgi:uncharacterized membrane protein
VSLCSFRNDPFNNLGAPRLSPARTRLLSALILFSLAAVLRGVLANERNLWADELFSLAMATGHSLEHPAAAADSTKGDFVQWSSAEPAAAYRRYLQHEEPPAGSGRVIRAVLLSDTSPPLYYLLLNWWTRASGTSDRAVRLFSVLWALAAFPLIWILAHRLGGWRAAVSTAVLYSLAPVSLYYSVEGRMYSMLWFLALAFMWLTVRLHDQGTRPGTLLLWTLAGAAGFLTHYFFAFVWAAGVLWILLHPGRVSRVSLVAAIAATAVAVLPWYLQLPSSLSRWRVTGTWLNVPLSWRQAISAPLLLAWNLVAGHGSWGGSRWGDRALAILFIILAVGIWRRRAVASVFRPLPRLLWLWVLAACLGPLVFDLLRGTMASLVGRYALAGLPAALLIAGLGLSLLTPRANAGLLAFMLLAWSSGGRAVFHDPRSWEPFAGLGRELSSWVQPGDLVIVHSIPSGVVGVARYVSSSAPVAAWVGQLGTRRLPRDLETLLAGRRRVALVIVHSVSEPAPEELWLRAHASLLKLENIRSARLLYFAPMDGPTFRPASAAESTRR